MRRVKAARTEPWTHPKEDLIEGNCETFRDTNGVPRTVSLFKETLTPGAEASGWEPLYTLKRFDVGEYKSMHKLFIEDADPTGYTTAMRTVGSFRQWQRMWNGAILAEHMEEWQVELEAKLTAEAVMKMRKSDNPTANKWLAGKGWEQRAGRPTKEAVAKQRKVDARVKSELAEDAERIRLVK